MTRAAGHARCRRGVGRYCVLDPECSRVHQRFKWIRMLLRLRMVLHALSLPGKQRARRSLHRAYCDRGDAPPAAGAATFGAAGEAAPGGTAAGGP